MTKEQYIIQECVRCNPEIVELKFGCVMSIRGDDKCVFLKMDDEYIYWIDSDGEYNDEDTIELKNMDWEIIGRPIRLADVLFAIANKNPKETYFIDDASDFGYALNGRITFGLASWNLLKDSLSDQTEETKSFIAALLSYKE